MRSKSSLTLGDWLKDAGDRLELAGLKSAPLEAQLIAASALGRDRSWVVAHHSDPLPEMRSADLALSRRLDHEPLAYILGWREFYGRRFQVNPVVLVPRQETETLVELTLELIPQNFVESILDLGTGSGCIAITLKLEMPSLQVSASDISHEAIEVARANAGALSAQVEFVESDRFSGLKSRPFDLIVSNPPYVGIEDGLPREVAEYEPKLALYGRPLWDSFYRQIAQEAPLVLKGPRIAAVEVGDYQYERVTEIFIEEGWVLVASKSDLGGMPRAMAFRMP